MPPACGPIARLRFGAPARKSARMTEPANPSPEITTTIQDNPIRPRALALWLLVVGALVVVSCAWGAHALGARN